jgi:hypothetical protein
VKFNEAIVKANEVISEVGSSYTFSLSTALSTGSYESIAATTDSALVKIDAELNIVKALEAPKGGDAYKEAAIKAYESLRAYVESGKKFSVLTKESSKEELNKAQNECEAKMKEFESNFDTLTQAQADYAKGAGYKVE